MTDFLARLSHLWKRSSYAAPRPYRQPQARFLPRLERLEDRTVPANLVTTAQVGTTLFITTVDQLGETQVQFGDNNQQLTIDFSGAGNLTISSESNFTTIGGAGASFNGITNIKLSLGLGNDAVEINQAQLAGTLTFLGGDGENTLNIGKSAGNNTFGNIAITNGDGFDTFVMHRGDNTVTGNVTIQNGNGDSTTQFGTAGTDQTHISGNLGITNGSGSDVIGAAGTHFTVGRAVTIKNGNGDSTTTLGATVLTELNTLSGATAIINGAAATNIVTLGSAAAGSSLNTRGLTIQNGNADINAVTVGAETTTLNGTTTITNGAATLNNVTLGSAADDSSLTTRGVTIKNGNADSNIVTLAAETTALNNLSGATIITNGAATLNNVTLGSGAADSSLSTRGVIITNGSAGTNLVTLAAETTTLDNLFGATIITNGAATTNIVALGSVTADSSLSTRGVTITNGSAGANNIVTVAAETTALNEVAGTTTIINGSAGTSNVVTLGTDNEKLTARSVAINNGNGANVTTIAGKATITGNLSVANGNGNDSFNTSGGDLVVTGAVTINQGNGTNVTAFDGGTTALNTLAGVTTISGGTGNDAITLGVGGKDFDSRSLVIQNGSGRSNVTIAGDTFHIAGGLSITNGDGADSVDIASTKFSTTGSVTISHGHGGSVTDIHGPDNKIGGSLTIRGLDGNDSVALLNTTVALGTLIDTGNDSDNVTINNSDFAAVTINGGNGNDLVDIEGLPDATDTTLFAGNVSILMGAGDDALNIGLNANDFARFNALATFNGGVGLDTLTQSVDNFFALAPAQPTTPGFEVISP